MASSQAPPPTSAEQKFSEIRTELLEQLAVRPARTREELLPYIDLYGEMIEHTPLNQDDLEFHSKVFATLCRAVSSRESAEPSEVASTSEENLSLLQSWYEGPVPLVKRKKNITLEKKPDANDSISGL